MKRLLALMTIVVLVSAGCGDSKDTASTTSSPAASGGSSTTASTSAGGASSTTAASGAAASTVKVGQSSLGAILVDGEGRTLYRFTPDTGTTSTCTGACATTWPAVPGPATGEGLDADDFGVTKAADGSSQTTFYGHPLYRFKGDSQPGDTEGQGLSGKWYVVDADGNTVTGTGGSASSTSAASATTVAPSSSSGY
jgi:predicted lipoprotein with Yx(FWY)xxD motif